VGTGTHRCCHGGGPQLSLAQSPIEGRFTHADADADPDSDSAGPIALNVGKRSVARSTPLGILGANFGRTTTLIRLQDSLLIHSSAPFSTATFRAILALGTPAWAVEATLAHDTFTHSLATLLPDVPWFVPQGLKTPPSAECHSLAHVPGEWRDHLDVIKIEGTPLTEEHAFFHRPSRTLIVADLIFNLSPSSNFWTRLVLRSLSGLKPEPRPQPSVSPAHQRSSSLRTLRGTFDGLGFRPRDRRSWQRHRDQWQTHPFPPLAKTCHPAMT
jgi:hypothetical protein